jgi:ElaB/YqjD/DUF883 family membrane-anchored ribosome-binding protein
VRLKTVDEQKVEQNAKVAQLKQKLKKAIFNEEDSKLQQDKDKLLKEITRLKGLLKNIPENKSNEEVIKLQDEINQLKDQLQQVSDNDTSKEAAADVSRLTGENEELVKQLRESVPAHQANLNDAIKRVEFECNEYINVKNEAHAGIIADLESQIEDSKNAQTPNTSEDTSEVSKHIGSLQAEINRLGDENAKAVGVIEELQAQVLESSEDLKYLLDENDDWFSGTWTIKYNEREERIEELKKELEGYVTQLDGSSTTISDLRKSLVILSEYKKSYDWKMEDADRIININEGTINTLTAEITRCGEEKTRLQQEIDIAVFKLATAAAAQKTCEADKNALQNALNAAKAELTAPSAPPAEAEPVVQPPQPQPVVEPQPPAPFAAVQPPAAVADAARIAAAIANIEMPANVIGKNKDNMTGTVDINPDNLSSDMTKLSKLAAAFKTTEGGTKELSVSEKRKIALFVQETHDDLSMNGKKGIGPGKYKYTIEKIQETGEFTMKLEPAGTSSSSQFPFEFEADSAIKNVADFSRFSKLVVRLIDGNVALQDEEEAFVLKFTRGIKTKGDSLTKYDMLVERGLVADDNYLGGLIHSPAEITTPMNIEMILNLIFTMHSCNCGKAAVEEGTILLGNQFKNALKDWMMKYVPIPEELDQDPMRPFIAGVHDAVTVILSTDAEGKFQVGMQGALDAQIGKINASYGTLDGPSKAEACVIFNRISAFLMTAPEGSDTFITVNDVCRQFQTVRAFVARHLDTTATKDADMPNAGTNVNGLTYVPSDTMGAGAVGTTMSSLERMMGMLNAGK